MLQSMLIPCNATRMHRPVSKGNAGACFATQQSAELLQSIQLETTLVAFSTLLQSICSLQALAYQSMLQSSPATEQPFLQSRLRSPATEQASQPCYRAGFQRLCPAGCESVHVAIHVARQ